MPERKTYTSIRITQEAVARVDSHAEVLRSKRPGETVSRTDALMNLIFEHAPEPRDEPTPQPSARRSRKVSP